MAKQPQKPTEKQEQREAPQQTQADDQLRRQIEALQNDLATAEASLRATTQERDELAALLADARDTSENRRLNIEATAKERDNLKAALERLDAATKGAIMPDDGWSSERARDLTDRVPPEQRPLLLGDLLAMLAPHAGETGQQESAADVLRRLVAEVGVLRAAVANAQNAVGVVEARAAQAEAEVVRLQNAMVAQRSPHALVEIAMDQIADTLQPVAEAIGLQKMPHTLVLSQLIREWVGLRELLGKQPMVALAVRDDGTEKLAERYSLLLMEWDGKSLSPTVLEGPARPWSDLINAMERAVQTRLVPIPFR